MKAAFALARSATRLAPLKPSDPRIPATAGTPASGSEDALATTTFSTFLAGAGVTATALLTAAEAAAAELAEEFPALEAALADDLPATAAAADEDELEEPLDPVEEAEDPLPDAADPLDTAAAAEPVDELDDDEFVGVVVETGFVGFDALALELPPDALAADCFETTATDELVDELLDEADAIPAHSMTTTRDKNILFI